MIAVILITLGLFSFQAEAREETVAFLGDGFTTGLNADPHFIYDTEELWAWLKTPRMPDSSSPRRLWPNRESYTGPVSWIGEFLIHGAGVLAFDAATASWAYKIGRRLGFSPGQIIIAAEDYHALSSGANQVQHLLKDQDGVLPEWIFVLFTERDICHLGQQTAANKYKDDLQILLRKMIVEGSPAPRGSKIVVLGHLGLTQSLFKPEVESKIVGKRPTSEHTCQSIRLGRPLDTQHLRNIINQGGHVGTEALKLILPVDPTLMCPALFGPPMRGKNEEIIQAANRIRAYRKSAQEATDHTRTFAGTNFPQKNIELHFLGAMDNLDFSPEQISEDCFHLSSQGHEHLAKGVWEHLKTSKLVRDREP